MEGRYRWGRADREGKKIPDSGAAKENDLRPSSVLTKGTTSRFKLDDQGFLKVCCEEGDQEDMMVGCFVGYCKLWRQFCSLYVV